MSLLRAVRVLKAAGAYAPSHFRFILGRVHVGTPDATVQADFERRTKAWPREAAEAATVYALAVHHSNGRGYSRVMAGRF